MCRDKKLIQKLLTNAGSDPAACDNHQHSVRYYLEHKEDLELPNINKSNNTSRKSTANKDSKYSPINIACLRQQSTSRHTCRIVICVDYERKSHLTFK